VRPEHPAFIASNNRDGPWPIAATLYRIYSDNSRAGSPASIVDELGSPRWYALWALVRYLRSYHKDFTRRGRRSPSGQRSPSNGDGSQPIGEEMGTRVLRLGLPGENLDHSSAVPLSAPVSAPENPTIGPVWMTGTSEGLADQAEITDKEDACSVLRLDNSPDLVAHPKHCKHVAQASVSGPGTSCTLPSLVVELSAKSSVSKTREKDIPVKISTLSQLQSLTASRIRDDEAAKKSAREQRRQALCYVERANDRVEDIKLQMLQAEKELREARGRAAGLKAAEGKHNHAAQCYLDFQKDLEQLARMRDEWVKGLRVLNVHLSQEILAGSMRPMIRGVADKYPDIAGDDAFIDGEDSAE